MLAATEVIIRLIVTGIVAIVPSAKDENFTRLIAPKHLHLDNRTHHPTIPDHFAFIDIVAANYDEANSTLKPEVRYLDLDDKEHVVFLLEGAEIAFAAEPINKKRTRNVLKPADLKKPKPGTGEEVLKGLSEDTSIEYQLTMKSLCGTCGPIANRYFRLRENLDLVSARWDFQGGHEFVKVPKLKEIWTARDSGVLQPLAQEVVYRFVMTDDAAKIEVAEALTNFTKKSIALKGNQVDVLFGNAPLPSILKRDVKFKGEHRDDHFNLVYDMYTAPKRRVLHIACPPFCEKEVSGPGDNCIPPVAEPQDPHP